MLDQLVDVSQVSVANKTHETRMLGDDILFVYLTRSPALCCRDVGLHGQSGSSEVSGAQHASSQPRHAAVHVSPSQTVGAVQSLLVF